MNRSQSKIRHIQESNKKLERKYLIEDTMSGDTISGDTTTITTTQNFYDWFKNQNFKPPKTKTKIYTSPLESDTLESIAKKYGVTVDDIVKENPGLTNDNLIPGQYINFQGYDIEM
jgi:LysM repeat protein